ncbi:MAG: hypothetical protein KDA52_15135 [Planctomycetaceae bacterium]|nr:hypothetical protein [Planctomycetaceae bacterium]
MNESQTSHVPSSSRRKRRFGRILLGLFVVGVVTHPWWLRGIGEFLVAEQPKSDAEVVLVLGGDHRLQEAAELIRDQTVSEVWLVELDPTYAVLAGILPADHIVASNQLVSMDVQPSQIRILNGRAREYDDAAYVLAKELPEFPETNVLILYERQDGRNVQSVFSELLNESQFRHLSFLGLPDDEYNETNWWRSRTGWKETFTAISDLAYTLVVGVERHEDRESWDPDAYERKLISQFGGAPCHTE